MCRARSTRVARLATFAGVVLQLAGSTSLPGQETSVAGYHKDDTVQKAAEAFTAEKWAEAETLYRAVTEQNPNAGGAWFRLGYALHAQGKLEGAIDAHLRAAEFPNLRAHALYNCGCAYALLNKTDEAFGKLEEAIEAGLNLQVPISEDSDWNNVRDLPRFKELAARIPQAVPEARFREFDFWVGEWEVVDAQGNRVGTNSITQTGDGTAIIENWVNLQNQKGMSVNYFDPADRQWHQTWIDGGGVTQYRGTFRDGAMRFEGQRATRAGTTLLNRMTLTPHQDGSVRQFIEQSTDGGQTWATYFDGKYVKQNK